MDKALVTDKVGSNSRSYSRERRALLIAFYLPQFHPIPENDEWWGPGFTEWTNVARSRSRFPGHHQPNIPGELGFYDLRLPETRAAQAKLAFEHGIGAFCYWHYWFGGGKRLLERPFNEVLASGEPDFPFCLAWANETWSGQLHGAGKRTLIKQEYPGEADYVDHFRTVLPAFKDKRYVTIDGKPIFLLYKPEQLPDPKSFIVLWKKLAVEAGLPGIYFIGIATDEWNPVASGFDAGVLNEPRPMINRYRQTAAQKIFNKITGKQLASVFRLFGAPESFSYERIISTAGIDRHFPFTNFPVVVPNWDTTPRMGKYAYVFQGSTPELFRQHLQQALDVVKDRDEQHRIVFVKSWNEWAEGNYLEPDRRYGRAYLNTVRDCVVTASEE